jgi:hypothetical protein
MASSSPLPWFTFQRLEIFLHETAVLSNDLAERGAHSETIPTISPGRWTPPLHIRPPAIYKLISTPVHAAERPCSPSSDAHPGARAGSPWSLPSEMPSTDDCERGRALSTSPNCSGTRLHGLRHLGSGSPSQSRDGRKRLHQPRWRKFA